MKNKLIISLLLFIVCTLPLKSMNKKTKDMLAYEAPELSYEMLNKIFFEDFINTFTPKTKPEKVKDRLNAVRLVDKDLCAFISHPKTTCTIINNIAQHSNQHITAEQIGTQETLRYFRENMTLSNHIFMMKNKRIRNKLSQSKFIDFTFSPKQKPLLFAVQSNLTKVKILLRCGANPDDEYQGKTILQIATEKHNNSLAKIVLAHNPKNKCLLPAIEASNLPILQTILHRKDITAKELNDGLHFSLNRADLVSMELLLTAGANPNLHLYDSVSRLLAALYGYETRDPEPLFNIIHTLCSHGAWNENAWSIVQVLKDKAPENLIRILEMGKKIAQRNEKI